MKKILVILGLTLALTTHYAVAASAAAGTVNGMTITIEEANNALNTLTKGKMTWERKNLLRKQVQDNMVWH
ncbi:hypothetical protein ACFLR6_03080 [Campylobacterota bacterium]